jgi:hypothetical protein
MRLVILMSLLVTVTAGCNQIQLRRNALQQAQSASDLKAQQVLDNLAMFIADPQAMPSFSEPDQGTVLVETTGTINLSLAWTPLGVLVPSSWSPSVQRRFNSNWVLRPIVSPDQLSAMRCIYQMAIGFYATGDLVNCSDCCTTLKTFSIDCNDPCRVPAPGWYCSGRKHDVPKHTRWVGRYRDVYVWVVPGGEEAFAAITLTIFQIAWLYPDTVKPAAVTVPSLAAEVVAPGQINAETPFAEPEKNRIADAISGLLDSTPAPAPLEYRIREVPANPAQGLVPAYGF